MRIFFKGYTKCVLILLILQAICQIVICRKSGRINSRDKCYANNCPRGEHYNGCKCKSNKNYGCGDYDEVSKSCNRCRDKDYYDLKIDNVQGNYCEQSSLLTFIIVFPI